LSRLRASSEVDRRRGRGDPGDAIYRPAQLKQPQWSPRTDSDAALAERIADEGLFVLGGHVPPPMGRHLLRVEQRRVYRPLGG
jgi:hypothetical protein